MPIKRRTGLVRTAITVKQYVGWEGQSERPNKRRGGKTADTQKPLELNDKKGGTVKNS